MSVSVESRARESLGIHAMSGAGLRVVVGHPEWGGRGREGGRGEMVEVESRARESLGGQARGGGGVVGL